MTAADPWRELRDLVEEPDLAKRLDLARAWRFRWIAECSAVETVAAELREQGVGFAKKHLRYMLGEAASSHSTITSRQAPGWFTGVCDTELTGRLTVIRSSPEAPPPRGFTVNSSWSAP